MQFYGKYLKCKIFCLDILNPVIQKIFVINKIIPRIDLSIIFYTKIESVLQRNAIFWSKFKRGSSFNFRRNLLCEDIFTFDDLASFVRIAEIKIKREILFGNPVFNIVYGNYQPFSL